MGYHVTGNAPAIYRSILSGMDPMSTYGSERQAELGPGLYMSAVPEYWSGRSGSGWSRFDKLTSKQKEKLAELIMNSRQMVDRNYLADFEKDRVRSMVSLFKKTGETWPLIELSGQPYNINVNKEPEFAKGLGIKKETPETPKVRIKAKGVFADLTNTGFPGRYEGTKALAEVGFSGAFTKPGMATNPESAIWKRSAITKIGPIALLSVLMAMISAARNKEAA